MIVIDGLIDWFLSDFFSQRTYVTNQQYEQNTNKYSPTAYLFQ